MHGIRSESFRPALRAVAIACAFLAPSAALGQVVNITNGTDPAAATTVCPGTTVWIDTFAVKSSTTATVGVTSITLTLPTNVQSWVTSISLNSAADGTGTPYGSGTPTGTSLAITTSGLTAPRSTGQTLSVYVLATIKADASLTAGTFGLTATATGAAPTGGSYADTAPPTTAVDNQAPGAITGLTATPSTGRVDLAWANPGGDFAEVLVDRRVSSAVTGAPADGTLYALTDPVGTGTVSYVGTAVTFPDTSLPGATYYYALWARDTCKNYSTTAATASAVVSGAPQTVPGTPGTPSFSSIAGTTLSVSWTAATGATSYKLERGASSSGPWTELQTGILFSSLPYPDGSLTPGTTYWYRVRGWNAVGDGPYSTAASVMTVALPGAPGPLQFSSVTQTSLTVSWTAASGATSHTLERGTSSSGPWTQLAATSPYPDSALIAGT
ncbi:MAG TPA: fibronectin type III domain-containing protein, partial [Anaeromyxobacter sp.]